MKEKIRLIQGRIFTKRERSLIPECWPKGWLRDPRTGLYLKYSRGHNMIVLAGLGMMAKSIQYGHADQGKSIRYMEVGTGSTFPTKSDTALETAALRVEIDSWDNTDIASDPVVMIASYLFDTTEANAALMECGLFQESAGAPMFCRGLFDYGYISNATQDDPCVITSIAHGLSGGEKILIENVSGMTELNDNQYYVDVLTADTFALYTDSGLTTSVDSSGYGAYVTASPDLDTWKLIIPKTSAETLTVNYSLTFPAD